MSDTKRWFVGYFSFSHSRVSGMRLITRRIHQDRDGEYVIVDGGRVRLGDERLSGDSFDALSKSTNSKELRTVKE